MLNDSDILARKTAYYQGYKDMACKIYLELDIEYGEKVSKGIREKLFELMTDADKEYAEYQHKYIDSIGGHKGLKV